MILYPIDISLGRGCIVMTNKYKLTLYDFKGSTLCEVWKQIVSAEREDQTFQGREGLQVRH